MVACRGKSECVGEAGKSFPARGGGLCGEGEQKRDWREGHVCVFCVIAPGAGDPSSWVRSVGGGSGVRVPAGRAVKLENDLAGVERVGRYRREFLSPFTDTPSKWRTAPRGEPRTH